MSGTMIEGLDDMLSTARQAARAAAAMDMAAAAKALAADGLLGLLAPAEIGGLDLPLAAAAAVIGAAESELTAFPLVETVLAARLLAAEQPGIAERIVAGEALVSIAWAGRLAVQGGIATGTVGRAPAGGAAQFILCGAEDGGGLLLDAAAAGVTRSEDGSFDLERPQARFAVAGAAVTTLAVGSGWTALREDALLLGAAGALDAAQTCLDATIAHVTQRRQFGRSLVVNQGLRFELARQRLAMEGARLALEHALAAAPQDPWGRSPARLVARASVAETAPRVIEAAIQLHGGMGFTWDMPLHRHLRRAKEVAARCDAAAAREALTAIMVEDTTTEAFGP